MRAQIGLDRSVRMGIVPDHDQTVRGVRSKAVDGHQQRREKIVDILRRRIPFDKRRERVGADNVPQENDKDECIRGI